MGKEIKLLPVPQPFISEFHRSDVMDPHGTASSSPLWRLPDISEQCSKRTRAFANPRQKPPATDCMQLGRGGDHPMKHVYNNGRHVRGMADASSYTSKERSFRDAQSKIPKYSDSGTPSRQVRHVKKSLVALKRAQFKSAQMESVSFEVGDFPDLKLTETGSPVLPVQHEVSGVSRAHSPRPQIRKQISMSKTLHELNRTGPREKHKPHQSTSAAKPGSSAVPAGQPTIAVTATDGSEPFTSWTNVDSRPPKGPASRERSVGSSTAQKKAMQEGGASKKRQRNTKARAQAQKHEGGENKSKVPVRLDIGNMLTILEKKQQSREDEQEAKPLILSLGGALPNVCHNKQDRIAHIPLDSIMGKKKKGKQREVPKAKKPTPLKRVILKEREERKQKRLTEERGLLPGKEESKPADSDAIEEQCEVNDTDQLGTPPKVAEDEPEGHEGIQTEEAVEGDEEEGGVQKPARTLPVPNKPQIHSRKFRDYCIQVLSKDVDECATTLLKELSRFRDRLYHNDPAKARRKRRLVMGLREVLRHLKLRKVKCVIISPNCERIQSKGGLDEALHSIIDTCREQGVPFVFALSRRALGHCVSKAVPVSLVGIFNYDGAQDHYHKMIELSSEARRAYEVMVEKLEPGDQAEMRQDKDYPGEQRHETSTDP